MTREGYLSTLRSLGRGADIAIWSIPKLVVRTGKALLSLATLPFRIIFTVLGGILFICSIITFLFFIGTILVSIFS